jgi:hypothetical protein
MLGHASLSTTQIYTCVSIKRPQPIHAATHPAARLERRRPSGHSEHHYAAGDDAAGRARFFFSCRSG